MPGMTVTLGYGKANFARTVATFACLKVTPPFNTVSAAVSGANRGGKQYIQCGTLDLNGGVSLANVEHPVGTVILLQVSWKRQGMALKDGAIFLRLRPGAPLYNIAGMVPLSPENMVGDNVQLFSGYADVLSADDLAYLRIQPKSYYLDKFMDPEELEECFVISKAMEETTPRPEVAIVATAQGPQLREVAQTPARRLIIRKR